MADHEFTSPEPLVYRHPKAGAQMQTNFLTIRKEATITIIKGFGPELSLFQARHKQADICFQGCQTLF